MNKKPTKQKKSELKKPRKTTKKAPLSPWHFWRRHWPAGLALLVLPFALYFASLSFGYVLDDKIVLSENNFVKKGFAGLREIFTTESFVGFLGEQQDLVAGARYRPLSIATFAVEHELWGLNPQVSHFFNILLYALTGLLLFRVLAFFLPKLDERWYLGLAFLASSLFLLHPVHTEVVANIKGRDEILALLFSLGALYYALRYVEYGRWWTPLLSGLALFLGLLAKENALTFIAVIPLTLWLFKQASFRQLLWATTPLAISAVAYLVMRTNVIGYLLDSGKEIVGIMNNPYAGTSTGERLATIMYTLGLYVKLLFVPHPLTHDYYPYQIPIINWLDWRAWTSLALYVGLIYVAVRQWRQRPVLSWSIGYYLITLSIVSNLVVSVGAPMNERFLYMPSIGFCVFLAWALRQWLPEKLPNNQLGTYLGLGLLVLVGLGYAVKTVTRVPAWRDEMALNRAAIEVSTNSARANSYMAYSLYQQGLAETDVQKQKAIFEEALPYVNRALEIYPEYSDAVTCKGGLVAGLYKINQDLDYLLNEFYQLLAARPVSFIDTYMEYLNPRADKDKLIAFYERAGYDLLARQQGNYDLAIKYVNYGLKLDPNHLPLIEKLADIYLMAKQPQRALTVAQRGLRLDPNSPKLLQVLQEAGRMTQ